MDSNANGTHETETIFIGLEDPIKDYTRLLEAKVENDDEVIEEETRLENLDKIASAMRDTIWKLIFNDEKNESNHKKAEIALKHYRIDACFHHPWHYNDWILLVREELFKRKMSSFWKNVICKYELGLCWARDSDYYDDMDDPAPKEFYMLNFDSDDKSTPTNTIIPKQVPGSSIVKSSDARIDMQKYLDIYAPCVGHHDTPSNDGDHRSAPVVIGIDDPLSDYKRLIETNVENATDDEQMIKNFKNIATKTQEIIWKLLFETCHDAVTIEKNLHKAELLLEAYKPDACFHNPWDYNEWIPKVRDELLKRKMFIFWKDVIVSKKLGLCWARDSDLFDDLEDPKPAAFYNITCADIAGDLKTKS